MERRLVAFLTIWFGLVFVLGYRDLISLMPLPLFGITVFALLAGLILFYFFQPAFKEYIRQRWSLDMLMVFHLWRIAAGALFLHFGEMGQLPETFYWRAGWGDILAGSLVPFVLMFGRNRAGYWVFNVIGFVDFVVAVGTGLFLSLAGSTGMLPIAQLPLALIPLFGVPISGISHIMAFDLLYRMQK